MTTLITAAQVAEILNVEPNTVHRLNKLRERAPELTAVEALALLPAPTETHPCQLWDAREVTRCRAYREGGDMAARAESVYVATAGIGADAGSIAVVLGYPNTEDFAHWVIEQREIIHREKAPVTA